MHMNPAAPHTYPQRILLMVTGRSPQVVTETIYALSVAQNPPFIPTEVRIITTSDGAQDARLSLLSNDLGWFTRLRQDWNLPEILFGAEQIQELPGVDGKAMSDIRTREDNDHTANFIVDTVRKLTEDDQCAVHVSLAGGRKTMGYFLGYALSLYGRAQDRLSHVLVSAPFESNRDFYYPTPTSRIIYSNHGASAQQRPLDAKDGEVTLADIPFVRLRGILPSPLKGLQTGAKSFGAIIKDAQSSLDRPAVTVDYPEGRIRIADGRTVKLSPTDLAFYGWLAKRCKDRKPPVEIPPEFGSQGQRKLAMFTEHLKEYRIEERKVGISDNPLVGRELKATNTMTYKFFHQRKTKIKKRLERDLGPLAARYTIQCLEEGDNGLYGLNIAPERITFIND